MTHTTWLPLPVYKPYYDEDSPQAHSPVQYKLILAFPSNPWVAKALDKLLSLHKHSNSHSTRLLEQWDTPSLFGRSPDWTTHLPLNDSLSPVSDTFSLKQTYTLHLAIPALKALYRAWSSRAEHLKYKQFANTLESAYTKIDKYYEKTTESSAYNMTMNMSFVFC